MNSCTCIIPFYNEENLILPVLSELLKVKEFNEIIFVDDGSIDNGGNIVKDYIKKFKHIKLIEYPHNHGKSYAVKQGLSQVKSDYVFFFDADLEGVKHEEVSRVITALYNHPKIDIGILRRIYTKRFLKIFMIDLLLSGERMLKTEDAKKIFSTQVSGYQMEMAINSYIEKKRKNGVWFPSSAKNTFKKEKYGILTGLKRDFLMYRNIFRYKGFFEYVRVSMDLGFHRIKSYKHIEKF